MPPLELVLPVGRNVLGERAAMDRVLAPGTAHLDEHPAAHLRRSREHRFYALI
jgi:hypothetical protein